MFHPHFHTYSEHVEYRAGLVYIYKTPIGEKTITSLRLLELAELEQRRVKERGGDFSVLNSQLENAKLSNITREEKLQLIQKIQESLA